MAKSPDFVVFACYKVCRATYRQRRRRATRVSLLAYARLHSRARGIVDNAATQPFCARLQPGDARLDCRQGVWGDTAGGQPRLKPAQRHQIGVWRSARGIGDRGVQIGKLRAAGQGGGKAERGNQGKGGSHRGHLLSNRVGPFMPLLGRAGQAAVDTADAGNGARCVANGCDGACPSDHAGRCNHTEDVMKTGFIGLGNAGGKLAGSLLRNGFELMVHDLDAALVEGFVARGAAPGGGPEAMMQDCDTIITCLPSPAASDAVLQLMQPHAGPGKTWIEMSTTDPGEVRRLGALMIAAGAAAADCPVSGGCHRADTGNISIFAGCDRATFDRILPLLTIMGRRVLHTGDLGTASVLKVMTNYLATANLLTLCEALTVMKAAGADMATTYEAIAISSGTSFVHETESQLILSGSRDVNFTMDLVQKDIGLFQALADAHSVPLEISPLVIEMMTDGQRRYGTRAQSDMMIARLEEATGLDVTAPGFPAALIDDEPEARGAEIVPRR